MTFLRTLIAPGQLLVLVFALSLTGLQSATAQVSTKLRKEVVIASGKAVSSGSGGALITWETSFEVGNLGFNIYRRSKSGLRLVNQTLVPGTAFTVGDRVPSYSGSSYSFFDADGSLDAQYVIETVLTSGKRLRSNLRTQFSAEFSTDAAQTNQKTKKSASGKVTGLWQQEFKDDARPADFTVAGVGSDAERQRWVAAQPGVKIAVKADGLYRITRQQLADAGFNVNAPVANWQLYASGIEQNLIVTGEQGGVLGADGYIEFFGYKADSSYTNTRVYYLVAGATAGRRMIVTGGGNSANRTPVLNYSAVTECKTSSAADCTKPTFYYSTPRNGETENFYGEIIFNATDAPLKLNTPFLDIYSGQSAVLEISLQGFTFNAHNVRVVLNGNEIGTITGNGTELMRRSFTVPISSLNRGENKVFLAAVSGGDTTLVDYVRLRYNRNFNIAGGQLFFPVNAQQVVQVGGFTSPNYRIFDVTDAHNVSFYKHDPVENSDGYSVIVENGANPRLLYAVADNSVLSPQSISANIPSDLYNTTLNKDLIIVTYKDWRTQADALATYRQGQGLTTAVVDVEDVYDEFSFGTALPNGIKNFFQRAAPDYAILMGDANIDPKNHLGRPAWIPNFVPSFQRDSAFGEIVTDEAFGDFLDDNGEPGTNSVSEFPIGRLPVRSVADAQAIVNKIIAFEQNLVANPFERGAVFISDDPIDYDFFTTNQNLAGRLPAGTTVQHVRRNGATNGTAGPVRTAIVNAVNEGHFIVGYAGHGSLTAWTSASILRNAETGQFTNGTNGRYSLFFFLTCLNGAFADFNIDSISEAILKTPNGGGVAVWASSGLTIADGQDVMAEKFYDLHRQAAVGTRLGDLTKPARLHSFDPDVRASWILLGDPTLKVR